MRLLLHDPPTQLTRKFPRNLALLGTPVVGLKWLTGPREHAGLTAPAWPGLENSSPPSPSPMGDSKCEKYYAVLRERGIVYTFPGEALVRHHQTPLHLGTVATFPPKNRIHLDRRLCVFGAV